MASNGFLFGLCLLFVLVGMSNAQLSSRGRSFYARSCPRALAIIQSGVMSAVRRDPRMGASLLRLHFHDCFVNGCDASVLLDDTSNFRGEKTAVPNLSLRGYEVIDAIKNNLERVCPGIVSCADTLAVAARDSVSILGGPNWLVPLGRRDSTTASLNAANTNLPSPGLNLNGLISAFSSKGFTTREMVALSGAHTIGQASCANFRGRLYGERNIENSFAAMLKRTCPLTGGNNNLSPLDVSPARFDNAYFKDLQQRKGLLHSDQQLFNNGATDSLVNAYASNLGAFRVDFANAMVKMGNLSPLTGNSGQIRRNCRRRN